jgi:hypothetical protein
MVICYAQQSYKSSSSRWCTRRTKGVYHIYICVCDKLFFVRSLFITEISILYVFVFVNGKVQRKLLFLVDVCNIFRSVVDLLYGDEVYVEYVRGDGKFLFSG